MREDVEKGSIGGSFENSFSEQGTLEETTNRAVKRIIAWQLQQVMNEQHISKLDMAKRLDTSRSQLDRLLDPENDSVTLSMLTRAAHAVGRQIRLELM